VNARGLALVFGAVLVVGAVLVLRWPSQKAGLDCPPQDVRVDDAGVAHCAGQGAPLAAGQLLTAGGKIDLNAASENDLAQVPGIGPSLAKALVDERVRLGSFKSWDEVDAVPGIGEAKLASLKAAADLK
jgi:competence protein ComEA